MLSNYTLAGGTAEAKGFATRFKNELQKLTPTDVTINVNTGKYLTWIGGSIVSSLSTFQQL